MGNLEAEAAAAIEAGVEMIEKYGWVQGRSGNQAVGFCAVGSMLELDAATRLACDRLDAAVEAPFRNVIDYNDWPDTTEAQVIDLMKRVAKDLRNEASPS